MPGDEKSVNEIDTPEWKAKVQREAMAARTGTTISDPVDLGPAADGYQLPSELVPRVVGEARKNTKVA